MSYNYFQISVIYFFDAVSYIYSVLILMFVMFKYLAFTLHFNIILMWGGLLIEDISIAN